MSVQLNLRLRVPSLEESIEKARALLFSQQSEKGYWWYTLESNETIGAGFIQLMHFLGAVDESLQKGLAARMLSKQRTDGSWALFYEGEGDLSTTVECYFSLRLAGYSPSHEPLQRAREFILSQGGLLKIRVFTRIHLALFGILPWSVCPAMPIWFVLLPHWCGISIYEFSSWARSCIVPLLLTYTFKPVAPIDFDLDELFCEPRELRKFRFPRSSSIFSFHNFFILFDKLLKWTERLPWHPGKKRAIRKAEIWVREHIQRTEDIYPAMAYGATSIKAMGYPKTDQTIQKCLRGLRSFQQIYQENTTPLIHQQACLSPHWDTPWVACALLEAGASPQDPRLIKAGRYFLQKEIKNFRGDWRFKNPKGIASGWSFEFHNDDFPDVDDTLQTLAFLMKLDFPNQEAKATMTRALDWLLSMQSKNGGWAAFDKNNLAQWVNKIPFADHGACLDPPTPDLTGRMVELLSHWGYTSEHPVIRCALNFLIKNQETFGGWKGRWAVNYIFGTWCVLEGLRAMGYSKKLPMIKKAGQWLQSIQNEDGGWGESCLSDTKGTYVPLDVSTASQTAWAVMGLMAAGEKDSPAVQNGIEWLTRNQNEDGGWEEPYFTGTGFPGHFYIRYHGYRQYFPLLALGRYRR